MEEEKMKNNTTEGCSGNDPYCHYISVKLEEEYKEEICPTCKQKIKKYTGKYLPEVVTLRITSKPVPDVNGNFYYQRG
jgi:hypothetical protein